MNWFEILKAPIETNWQALDEALKRDQIAYRIIARGGEQVLILSDTKDIPLVEKRVEQWQQGVLPDKERQHKKMSINPLRILVRMPMVIILAFLSVIGFAITELGINELLALFAFQIVTMERGDLYISQPTTLPLYTQWWKFITPMFLHFGIFHLAFNLLWLFELGRKIEIVQSASRLLIVVLVTGIAANISQFWSSPDTLFGGFSGAVYGLLGYCVVNSYVYNTLEIKPRRGVPTLLIVWLLIGFSGVISMLGIANIANVAHLGGLISGIIVGILPPRVKKQ